MLYVAIGIFITTCVAGSLYFMKQRQAVRYADWSDDDEPDVDVTIVMGTREKF